MHRFKMIASVYLILIENKKILLLRRYHTGYEDGNYSLPAGHVENNESITSALRREIKEEISIDLNSKDLQLVHIMHRKEADIRVDFFFIAKNYYGKPTNTEPEKCDDLHWFSLNDLPNNTITYIKVAIDAFNKRQLYSELGWD